MRALRSAIAAAAGLGLLCLWALPQGASAQTQENAQAQESGVPVPPRNVASPSLVTIGRAARRAEGDHDFRQVIRISVPEGVGRFFIKVFDPDIGGLHDELLAGFGSSTRFSLFGDGASVRIFRDRGRVAQEQVSGEPIASVVYGEDAEADGKWVSLFEVDAAQGSAANGMREFLLLADGIAGADGNVYDVQASTSAERTLTVPGARLYSYMPTVQLPNDPERLAEMRFAVPGGVKQVRVENYDAAGGTLEYAGRFESRPVASSEKSKWAVSVVDLPADDPGSVASVTARAGEEQPNDMTLLIQRGDAGEAKAGEELEGTLIPIVLPVRVFAVAPRPQVQARITSPACRSARLDASLSSSEGDSGTRHRWLLRGVKGYLDGAVVETALPAFGAQFGTLEVYNGTGMVGSGRKTAFGFLVKEPPVARLSGPSLVAEGASGTIVRFDATGSTASRLPSGNRLREIEWRMGDGAVVVQREGETGFGLIEHRYASPGEYLVEVVVRDDPANPCNEAIATQQLRINANPVAQAGSDREAVTGIAIELDGSASSDADGAVSLHAWDFGDGHSARGPKVRHAWHAPGDYSVRLRVRDDDAIAPGSGETRFTVSVRDAPNAPPVANVRYEASTVVGRPVRFDASGSADPDGRILSWKWEFGDGATSDEPAVEHTWWQPGTYVVRPTLGDDRAAAGGVTTQEYAVQVGPEPNQPPQVDLAAELAAHAFETLRFDATNARDPDGQITRFAWDFGDGATSDKPAVDHLYSEPGTYLGKLVITDNGKPEPLSLTKEFTVTVTHADNLAPVADAGPPVEALVGETVMFDASASRDGDGTALTYAWDFGDGRTSDGVRVGHVYQFPGTYEAVLTVTDSNRRVRLSSKAFRTVTVSWPANAAPVAVIDAGGGNDADIEIEKHEIVRFDGSASSDADGNILKFDWDFGDGGTSPDESPRHAFHDAGVFEVRLVATDDSAEPKNGAATIRVTVRERSADAGGEVKQ
jgi:PKD repeat protein